MGSSLPKDEELNMTPCRQPCSCKFRAGDRVKYYSSGVCHHEMDGEIATIKEVYCDFGIAVIEFDRSRGKVCKTNLSKLTRYNPCLDDKQFTYGDKVIFQDYKNNQIIGTICLIDYGKGIARIFSEDKSEHVVGIRILFPYRPSPFQIGDIVEHPFIGEGRVTRLPINSLNGNSLITVQFKDRSRSETIYARGLVLMKRCKPTPTAIERALEVLQAAGEVMFKPYKPKFEPIKVSLGPGCVAVVTESDVTICGGSTFPLDGVISLNKAVKEARNYNWSQDCGKAKS